MGDGADNIRFSRATAASDGFSINSRPPTKVGTRDPAQDRDDIECVDSNFKQRTLSDVIARLDRATQYAAASRLNRWRLWNTGSPAGACHRARIRATRWRATTGEADAPPRSRDVTRPTD
jgi:hypothetical protein